MRKKKSRLTNMLNIKPSEDGEKLDNTHANVKTNNSFPNSQEEIGSCYYYNKGFLFNVYLKFSYFKSRFRKIFQMKVCLGSKELAIVLGDTREKCFESKSHFHTKQGFYTCYMNEA